VCVSVRVYVLACACAYGRARSFNELGFGVYREFICDLLRERERACASDCATMPFHTRGRRSHGG
jgi:hypothetical protein